ncbi:MAG TPA: branched-chain amino acid ABC transporter substrate-binding protein [Acidimicrobiales bacterium]|nr:branched-chain amino acid ABC transporter substrate-binding protein [Acidimicrobiales bacterium]
MRSPRPVRSLALVALIALLLTACGDDGGGDETGTGQGQGQAGGQTYALAFVGPLTGDNANLGINIRNGAKVAVQEANRGSGPRIELKEFDTQGDPAQATTLSGRFLNDQSIIGMVGPTFSGETRAVMQSLQDAGLVMVSASATNAALPTAVPNQTVFHRLVPDDDVQGQGLADYVSKELNLRRAAYIHDNSEYGKGLADGTQKLLEGAGLQTVGTDTVDPRSQDFSAVVNRMRSINPDLIFYGGYYSEAGRLRKQLVDGGVRARFLSGDGSLDPGFVTAAGAAAAEGALVTCACKLATEDAGGKLGEFARTYRQVNNATPGTYSTEGYDAANILIAGIRDGKTDRRALLDHVENLGTYEGVGKTVNFEPNGNIRATGVFVYEVKGGKLTELGTTEELTR